MGRVVLPVAGFVIRSAPVARDALDRHRPPPVEHAVFDGNVKVRIRHEDHLEKCAKALRVQGLWIMVAAIEI